MIPAEKIKDMILKQKIVGLRISEGHNLLCTLEADTPEEVIDHLTEAEGWLSNYGKLTIKAANAGCKNQNYKNAMNWTTTFGSAVVPSNVNSLGNIGNAGMLQYFIQKNDELRDRLAEEREERLKQQLENQNKRHWMADVPWQQVIPIGYALLTGGRGAMPAMPAIAGAPAPTTEPKAPVKEITPEQADAINDQMAKVVQVVDPEKFLQLMKMVESQPELADLALTFPTNNNEA